MDFGLSDEQLMMQDTVRALLQNEHPPLAILETLDHDTDRDTDLWSSLSEMGLVGMFTPEAHGGSGFELLDAALMAEVAGEAAMPGPLFGHQLATLAVMLGGSEDQQAEWLPSLASGERIGTIAWAEPNDRWDPTAWTLDPVGGTISGTKVHVPAASLADLVVVGVAGGGLVVVEPSDGGVGISPFDAIDRTRRLGELTFHGAKSIPLPDGNRAAPRVLDAGLVLLAADAFGSASRLLHETIEYLSGREQFDTRLTQFQGIKHELANMAVNLEPTRALWWYAAHALDHVPDEAPRVAAIAKAHIADHAMQIARACVDLHGAMGFTWESTVHLWYKRIIFDRAFLGGPGYHRDRAATLASW